MKNQLTFLLLLASFIFSSTIFSQETFPRNGVADHREGLYAFTNATIYKSYNQKLENATLVIREGKVEAIGEGVKVPQDAVIIDLMGKTIYPSFIDMYAEYGMPEAKRSRERRRGPQPLSKKDGAYSWNQALKPEFQAYQHFTTDSKAAKELRAIGFGTVLSHQHDGISRGTSTLVTLGEGREHEIILEQTVGHHLSFSKGTSTQSYPSSLMGAIALIRQTYLDGKWYDEMGKKEETNASLDYWNWAQDLKQVFEVRDKLEMLRAAKIGKEFGVNYIFKGNGDEYQRLDAIKNLNAPIILPVNFPATYDVEDPIDAMAVTIGQMKHWEMAPANASKLAGAGIEFAFTSEGLKKKSTFLANIKKAIKYGLSEENALKALTETPAKLMGVSNRLGSLENGKLANFIITDGNIFDKKTKIHHNWVSGKAFVIKALSEPNLDGLYNLQVARKTYNLNGGTMEIIVNDSTKIKVKKQFSNNIISLSFTPDGEKNAVRLSGTVEENEWSGKGQLGDGTWVNWKATYTAAPSESKDKKRDEKDKNADTSIGEVVYPFMAYGWKEAPKGGNYILKNATVWTNESEGILEQADVLIKDGKIAEVGKTLSGGVTEIDCTGKHVTSGIIDEHTHIGVTRGVNEGTQASSAEVRIGDVINSEDINIYRQLAGGVTAAQVLHGSANPIGGQSAIIKFRWGYEPEKMKFEGADGFIKFALGENVKQSNRSRDYSTRFPQTRMGVEQVYEDYFTRALEYGELKKSGKPYRKDLDLETLLEILNEERFITCHSYRQSEINMLMKVAERHNFKVNTFTHILEGYKVADKMAAHGAGGSAFSDWWAYKFEVYEAIPHNGAMMHEQGVTVAFNSDDAEMARRLNQEAAKAVRFGGVSEEEAWKFVTLNPAKLLHLDDRVGSIKSGKDADLVIWSENPLSIYAKAEKTFIDGIIFFDIQRDAELRKEINSERNRLIQKMLAVKKEGGKMQKPRGRRGIHYHCDDVEDEGF